MHRSRRTAAVLLTAVLSLPGVARADDGARPWLGASVTSRRAC